MMKNITKIILDSLKLFNFKNPTPDKLFFKEKKNFLSSPYNFFYINTLLLKKNITLKIPSEQIIKGINFLLYNQNSNGSFDEWYIKEDSFCATSYTGYLLSKIKNDSKPLSSKINKTLKKIDFFLKKKNNFNNFNQELARFAFYSNFRNQNKKRYKKKILNKTLEFDNYEYDGIDLGYLSVNLMILSDILMDKFDKIIFRSFINQLELYSNLSDNFQNFSNYIFSRSSRLILFSGFLYAYKKGLIRKSDIKKIYDAYVKTLNLFIKINDKKYLSFFYSSDFAVISKVNKKKINKQISLNKLKKKPIKNFVSFTLNKKKIHIYLRNANLFSIKYRNINKYYFDYNINYFNSTLVPKLNQKIVCKKNYIFMKNSFVKIGNFKKYLNYFENFLILNKFIKLGKIIKILGQYFFIKPRKFNNLVCYKKIYVTNGKIKVKEIIISHLNKFVVKKNMLLADNKQNYFSPTSFILNNEVGNKFNTKIKFFIKLKKKIFVHEYECS